jgi:hypothetical protein
MMQWLFDWEWPVFMKAMRRIRDERLARAAGVVYVDFEEVMEAIRKMDSGETQPASDEELREIWGI